MLLEDSGAPLLVTQSGVAEKLPARKCQTIVLDENGGMTAGSPEVPPATDTKAENLAYIIFTSGSTGRPKGVQVTHANLLNLIGWHQNAFKVTSADRATMHASPGFDASVWEIWPYLAAGASVHVIDEAVRATPERLRDWMVDHGITISFLPTALAEAMIDLRWPHETALRTLLTGGDVLGRRPPSGLPFALVNNYGPTECTVVATSGTVQPAGPAEGLPAIGRPITNTQIYIVDDQLRRVPAGRPGELLIGGVGVSRGYLNLPESTAEKFVPDPFSSEPGARAYRTGDVGRFLPDGQIAFMGRIDEQIKIRGYRIEPHEISTVLDRHPSIRASCVSSYSDGSAEMRLVAYVVPTQGARPTPRELRKFLGDYLPDYMIPSTFVQVPELLVSLGGKLDRAALPKPSPENILDDDSFEAPQSQIEERLASFMTVLLRVPRVGRDDNFFTLGGHSLMGAQMVAKIQDTFGVELSLRSIFDHPTLREMSSEIEKVIHTRLAAMSEEEARQILQSQDGMRP
jgi:amino acid adenylation domain-containing protein